MNRIFANIISAFVISKSKRRELRRKLCGNKIVGKGNKVIVVENGVEKDYTNIHIPNLKIEINGDNNLIYIPDIKSFLHNNSVMLESNNAEIRFGKSEEWFKNQDDYLRKYTGYRNFHICTHHGNNQKMEIGNNIEISGANVNMGESDCHLIIGDFCMLSNNITFQVSDGHSLLDRNSKKILNKVTHPMVIGEHSWIARSVVFMKNASIAPNTIVGFGSIVTKVFEEEYIAIAGNPAKIVKREVTWDHTPPSLWNDCS